MLLYQQEHPDRITVCLPESFEWLLLASGIIKDDGIAAILVDPGSYIDPSVYFSWEQFFVALLREATSGTAFAYSKSRLAEAYVIPANAEMVMRLISKENIC